MPESNLHFDVIIVGAGLSGIGAAHHISTRCPGKTFTILEARESMGGTWDLFRYPGIRSDSDMYTLGYSFKPWIAEEAIADGPAILSYIKEAAVEGGFENNIRYNHKVQHASWSSSEALWTITVGTKDQAESVKYTCGFLFMCSGYYNYDEGYTPDFKGLNDFSGTLVHPQKWPQSLDYTGKKIIIIGSGATAVTLVPELAEKAEKVIMLQRSPTYIMSAPQKDKIANFLRKILPGKLAYGIARWKNILTTLLFYKVCKKWPQALKKLLMKGVKKELGPGFDVEKHFSPHYNPWDQRLCLVPESDLFKSIRSGKSEVVTDHVERFVPEGIMLRSGTVLDADIIVTATGLNLQFLGGMTMTVDGKDVDSSQLFCYRGMMYSDIPNMAQAFGYTNASWTLKCDLTCEYVCRLINFMDKHHYSQVIPRLHEDKLEEEPLLDLTSNYIMRSANILPKQGSKKPWKLYQNYVMDIFNFRYSSFKDRILEFTS